MTALAAGAVRLECSRRPRPDGERAIRAIGQLGEIAGLEVEDSTPAGQALAWAYWKRGA